MGRYSGATCRLWAMLVLTAGFFVAELVSGYLGNSIALLSDSFNMLSDLISLCVGLASRFLARRARWSVRASFGYARAEVVGALANAVFLTALCFTIFVEAVLRLARPERVDDPGLVLVVGALGLAVNIVGLLIFQDCVAGLFCCFRARRARRAMGAPGDAEDPSPSQEKCAAGTTNPAGDSLAVQTAPEETVNKKKSDALNIRGVLLHVMGDALGSVIVVITATIFYVLPLTSQQPCNWQCYIDPSLTVIMVVIILSSAFPLIKETASILLQMVPPGVNMEELMSKLSTVPGVSSVHEVHVWELVSGKIIATLHIKHQEDKARQEASEKVREIFHHAGIHSVTIQFESVDSQEFSEHKDFLLVCSSPCVSQACADKLCCPPGMLPLAHVNGCAEHNGGLTLESYRSRTDPMDVAVMVSRDDCLGSSHADILPKAQEDQRCENSTHF
ncbi:zinc transporter 10 isoform X1 [Octodon degus]|uniref:Zinc transporter 10 isoform X1 n=1 Tax=Octodon degus TaxID=10160 RepID=A0A6P6E1J5_OCTDE|nr:zinc transporter 10 isoform X1 [Octodon degus]